MDRAQVIDRVRRTRTQQDGASEALPEAYPDDWRHISQKLKSVVKDSLDKVVKELTVSIHRASTETTLLRLENEGLKASLAAKNKRRSHGKTLQLQGADETTVVLHSGLQAG
jgi:regulator of replication initiation timing